MRQLAHRDRCNLAEIACSKDQDLVKATHRDVGKLPMCVSDDVDVVRD